MTIVTYVVNIDAAEQGLRHTDLELAKELSMLIPSLVAGVKSCFIAEMEIDGEKVKDRRAFRNYKLEPKSKSKRGRGST